MEKNNTPSSLYAETRRQRQRRVESERSEEEMRQFRQKQRRAKNLDNQMNQPKGCFGKFCDTIKKIIGGRKTKNLRKKYKKTRNIKKNKSKIMIV